MGIGKVQIIANWKFDITFWFAAVTIKRKLTISDLKNSKNDLIHLQAFELQLVIGLVVYYKCLIISICLKDTVLSDDLYNIYKQLKCNLLKFMN